MHSTKQNPTIFVRLVDPQSAGASLSFDTVDCFLLPGTVNQDIAEQTLDLQPLMDADADFPRTDYPPALLNMYQKNGSLHALIYAVDFPVLFYDQTAFKASALEAPRIDWSLDQFLAAAQALTVASRADNRYGFVSKSSAIGDLLFFLRQYNAVPLQAVEGKGLQPNFTDPSIVKALTYYIELAHTATPHTRLQGYEPETRRSESDSTSYEGQAAMWFSDTIASPPLGREAGGQQTVAVAPRPYGDKAPSLEELTTTAMYISARTQQAQECWIWMKYISAQAPIQQGSFPARRSVVASEQFSAQAPPSAVEVYNTYSTVLERAPASSVEQTNETRLLLAKRPMYYYWFFRAVDRALQGRPLEHELSEAQRLTVSYLRCIQTNTAARDCAMQVDPSYEQAPDARVLP